MALQALKGRTFWSAFPDRSEKSSRNYEKVCLLLLRNTDMSVEIFDSLNILIVSYFLLRFLVVARPKSMCQFTL